MARFAGLRLRPKPEYQFVVLNRNLVNPIQVPRVRADEIALGTRGVRPLDLQPPGTRMLFVMHRDVPIPLELRVSAERDGACAGEKQRPESHNPAPFQSTPTSGGNAQFNGYWDITVHDEKHPRAWWLKIEGADTASPKGD